MEFNQRRGRRLELFSLLVVLLMVRALLAAPVPHTLTGRVTKVMDGDTIEVLSGRSTFHVRLEGIDAPERGQPFATSARKFLSMVLFGQTVNVRVSDKDRYGRFVGRVLAGGADVNRLLVARGLAWHYKQFSQDPGLSQAERLARQKKEGLWSENNPVPPWEFRAQRHRH